MDQVIRGKKMTFDPTKPVQTRDGKPARIICTDYESPGGFPIIALVKSGIVEYPQAYKADGGCSFNGICETDLINVPTKAVRWINIYADGFSSYPYYTNEEADANAHVHVKRIGGKAHMIEWEEEAQ
jgi:hypothetical protein